MTRQKKSRTAPALAPTQKPRQKNSVREELANTRKKKPKGHKPGSRNAQEAGNHQSRHNQQQQDSRHGSKTPISLNPATAPDKVREFAPQVKLTKNPQLPADLEKELETLENDERLLALLERVENDEVLKGKDAKYFNTATARHQQLMELLGIDDDDFDDDEDDDEPSDTRSLVEQWEDDE